MMGRKVVRCMLVLVIFLVLSVPGASRADRPWAPSRPADAFVTPVVDPNADKAPVVLQVEADGADMHESVAPLAVLATTWGFERVDEGREFDRLRDRSLALDATGRPHAVYGGKRLYYAFYDGAAWQITTVDGTMGVGWFASLALDAAGRPHIAYYDQTNADLRYALYDGTAWMTTTVDSAGDAGAFTSIALDAAGRPHISYCYGGSDRWTCAGLRYASYDGTAWLTTTVDSGPYVGAYTSLALDAADAPHIGYWDGSWLNGGVCYAHFTGTAWLTTTVDRAPDGGHVSLALDGAGRPHLSYSYHSSDSGDSWQGQQPVGSLRYASYDGTAWVTTTVSGGWDVNYTSLALDAADRPHISYRDYARGLRYASYDGTGWVSATVVPATPPALAYSSLALDAAGRPHVVYCSSDWPPWEDRCLRLNHAVYENLEWQIELVDTRSSLSAAALALDGEDEPHIVYGTTFGQVRYARREGDTWRLEPAGGLASFGRFSLELDEVDRPHVAYQDTVHATPHYAFYSGTAWLTMTVDDEPGGFSDPSLALDAAGRPHVSYPVGSSCPGSVLRYASYDGLGWISSTVDWGCEHSSLALDGAGRPHISYWNPGLLQYALYSGTAWLTMTVAPGGRWGSIAVDVQGRPQMAYYTSVSSDSVRYASYDGMAWVTATVDHGAYPALALDAAGRPHIAYVAGGGPDLRYASFDGTAWITTTVVAVAEDASLALDAAGRPRIAYISNGDLWYAFPCTPVAVVTATGPTDLFIGDSGTYAAAFVPVSATVPIFTWNNGTVGPAAVYSWTTPGTYTVSVVARNGCSTVGGALVVQVRRCQPVEGVSISGLPFLYAWEVGFYTATYAPLTATTPLTLAWNNGAMGPTAAYSWTIPGFQTVAVTATNPCAVVSMEMFVYVRPWYRFYIPLMVREDGPVPGRW